MITKITKTSKHDKMSLTAKFESGASLKLVMSRPRSNEAQLNQTVEVAFSNDKDELKKQAKIVSSWLERQEDETNQDIFDRLEIACEMVKSGSEFIKLITTK